MCGIFGLASLESKKLDCPDFRERLESGLLQQRHRGPDATGSWISDNDCVFLGHNRLSIVDLGARSNQPYITECGKYIGVFNGEIYNHAQLGAELQKTGYSLRTTGDTEILFELFARDGVRVLDKLRGMFAFAVYDTVEEIIYLARDPVGEKPLFFSSDDETFAFASELNTLMSTGDTWTTDLSQLKKLFNQGYSDGNASLLNGITKLPPGHYASMQVKSGAEPYIHKYFQRARNPNIAGSCTKPREVVASEFDALFGEVVEDLSRGDAEPVFLLSGGLDSSYIAVKAAERLGSINTITVAFSNNDEFDESDIAASIAEKIGSKHHEIVLTHEEDVLSIIDKVLDEPFIDSSIIPTSLLFEAISKQGFKVAVGGDGADELFGGYKKYNRLWKLHQALRFVPAAPFDTLSPWWLRQQWSPFKNWIRALPQIARSDSHFTLASLAFSSQEVWQGAELSSSGFPERTKCGTEDFVDECLRADFHAYLPEDLLVKVDRCSMAYSVEARSPFLDKRIIDFCDNNLRLNYTVNHTIRKGILAESAKQYFPAGYDFSRKAGFRFPVKQWLNSEVGQQAFSESLSILKALNLDSEVQQSLIPSASSELKFGLICLARWVENNSGMLRHE